MAQNLGSETCHAGRAIPVYLKLLSSFFLILVSVGEIVSHRILIFAHNLLVGLGSEKGDCLTILYILFLKHVHQHAILAELLDVGVHEIKGAIDPLELIFVMCQIIRRSLQFGLHFQFGGSSMFYGLFLFEIDLFLDFLHVKVYPTLKQFTLLLYLLESFLHLIGLVRYHRF